MNIYTQSLRLNGVLNKMRLIYRIICRLLLFFGYEDKSFELYKKHVMGRRKNHPPEPFRFLPTDLVNLRPTGHGERRVFTIPVGNITDGNMTDEETEEYVQRVANSFKRDVNLDHMVDPITGQFDLKYNPLHIDEDFYLPLRPDPPGIVLYGIDPSSISYKTYRSI